MSQKIRSNRKLNEIILNSQLFNALLSIYTPKKEIFFFLIGEINGNKVFINDAKYVLQESSFDSVYFKDLPSGFIGAFHTHPSNCKPSEQDLRIFNKLGGVHIILGKNCIKAYDMFGNELRLIILTSKKDKLKEQDQEEMKFHYVLIYTIIISTVILLAIAIISYLIKLIL